MMSHAQVIEAFGGTRPLAETIGVRPTLAVHWPERGIPAKYWHLVIDAAPEEMRNRLSIRALAETKPRKVKGDQQP